MSILDMIIAAPLWAAAHLHPEGEGMASKHGGSGYTILIELVLRPALMICGLIAVFVVVDPFLRSLSAQYFKVMGAANGEARSGLVKMVAFISIFIGMSLTITRRSFALIHIVPNTVLRWIGAHANSYDDGALSDLMKTSVKAHLRVVGRSGETAAPGLAMEGKAKSKTDAGGDAAAQNFTKDSLIK